MQPSVHRSVTAALGDRASCVDNVRDRYTSSAVRERTGRMMPRAVAVLEKAREDNVHLTRPGFAAAPLDEDRALVLTLREIACSRRIPVRDGHAD